MRRPAGHVDKVSRLCNEDLPIDLELQRPLEHEEVLLRFIMRVRRRTCVLRGLELERAVTTVRVGAVDEKPEPVLVHEQKLGLAVRRYVHALTVGAHDLHVKADALHRYKTRVKEVPLEGKRESRLVAKAYVRPGALDWERRAVSRGGTIVAVRALAHAAAHTEMLRLAVVADKQRQRAGSAAVQLIVEHVRATRPAARDLRLRVHPENQPAQRLYRSRCFSTNGLVRDGEPVWALDLKHPCR
jgi:RimJ/RimL family protein N-acetyltransferase